jgi:hypothetical protein
VKLIDKYVGHYLKAHTAGALSALALVLAFLNSKAGLHTADQWYAIVGAYLGVGGAVSVVPNATDIDAVVAKVAPAAAVPVIDAAVNAVVAVVAPPVSPAGQDPEASA